MWPTWKTFLTMSIFSTFSAICCFNLKKNTDALLQFANCLSRNQTLRVICRLRFSYCGEHQKKTRGRGLEKKISLSGVLVPDPLRAVYIWNRNLWAVRLRSYSVRATLAKPKRKGSHAIVCTTPHTLVACNTRTMEFCLNAAPNWSIFELFDKL